MACKHSGKLKKKGCNITGGGGVIKMPQKHKRLIEGEHNNDRSEVALGGLGFPPADRMPPLIWNEELAYLAELNVMRCEFGHDKTRQTDEFKFAGQNIAQIGGGTYPDEETAYKQMIKLWYDEYKKAKIVSKEGNVCFKPKTEGDVLGHFTAMISDKSMAVGCAALKYKHKDNGQLYAYIYFVCNYAYANMGGEQTYKPAKKGDAPGHGCKKMHPKIKGLCSRLEKVSPTSNPWLWRKEYINSAGTKFTTMKAAKASNKSPISTAKIPYKIVECPAK